MYVLGYDAKDLSSCGSHRQTCRNSSVRCTSGHAATQMPAGLASSSVLWPRPAPATLPTSLPSLSQPPAFSRAVFLKCSVLPHFLRSLPASPITGTLTPNFCALHMLKAARCLAPHTHQFCLSSSAFLWDPRPQPDLPLHRHTPCFLTSKALPALCLPLSLYSWLPPLSRALLPILQFWARTPPLKSLPG